MFIEVTSFDNPDRKALINIFKINDVTAHVGGGACIYCTDQNYHTVETYDQIKEMLMEVSA